MASVRPTPQSYYYSGQGRLGIGTRTSDGKYQSLVFVGNVTALTVNIATTKFEHKESMTGNRGIDLTIVQEKNATFTFNAESLTLELLALGLYGKSSKTSAAAVANELHEVIELGTAIPLMHPNVSSVSITPEGGGSALVEGTDYQVDEGFGTIYPLNGGIPLGKYNVTYNHGAFDQIDAFTNGTPPERYLRFEGLNTVNGDLRLIEIPRAAFDPLTGLEFINEELGAGEFNGNVLPDLTVTAADVSQYFRERRIYAAGSSTGAPAPLSASVSAPDVDVIALTFDAAITSSAPSGAGGFTVTASGGANTVTGVTIAGAVVSLALSRDIAAGETVSVSYTPPGTNPLAGVGGLAPAFVGQTVTNNVT